MIGGKILLETLKLLGTKHIFGYPGGAVLSIFDALYYDKELQFILTRHEQGAAHAADAYGRVTGKPGVCIATSGPGGTNLVTGIMTAYMDSSPMIAITGQVPSGEKGLDNFQEVDIIGITLPITKHSFTVTSAKDLPRILTEAYSIATTGRPGPVLIDIPADIQLEEVPEIDIEGALKKIQPPVFKTPNIGESKLKRAVSLMNSAKRPVIISGAGVIKSGTSEKIRKYAIENDIPVTMTLLGLGGFPGDHDLSLGMGGIHGGNASYTALEEADVVLVLGARLENRFTGGRKDFLKDAKVIHVDIDPSELGKNIQAEVAIHGDIDEVLNYFIEASSGSCNRQVWRNRIADLKAGKEDKAEKTSSLSPKKIFDLLNKHTLSNAVICTGVGQHQMLTAQYYNFAFPNQLITSGGAGTMGFGIPAALGVKLAHPEKNAISIVGDGDFQMTSQELMCIKDYNLPVKIIVINNNCLGMVKQLQDMFKEGRHQGVYLPNNPDFICLAKAYGIKGVRTSDVDELSEIFSQNINSAEPVLIECILDKDFNVSVATDN